MHWWRRVVPDGRRDLAGTVHMGRQAFAAQCWVRLANADNSPRPRRVAHDLCVIDGSAAVTTAPYYRRRSRLGDDCVYEVADALLAAAPEPDDELPATGARLRRAPAPGRRQRRLRASSMPTWWSISQCVAASTWGGKSTPRKSLLQTAAEPGTGGFAMSRTPGIYRPASVRRASAWHAVAEVGA